MKFIWDNTIKNIKFGSIREKDSDLSFEKRITHD